jgi:tetratricopeptide (TPR) repeat protein
MGCYIDVFSAADRDVASSLFLDDGMTPGVCEKLCGQHGYSVFGLQYSNECWCGETFGKYGKAEKDEECDMRCKGDTDIFCGGELRNSVYRVSEDSKVAVDEHSNNAERPLLALVMIVKDEAHTLPRTLMPLRQYIDYYYILDTGSTDGTLQAIRDALGENGEIWEEPFIDYGTSRNRVMDIATQADNPPIFQLMLSADETVYNMAALRKFCQEHRNSVGPQHEAYPVVMDVGWKFDSVRLSRTDAKWRYVGKVHEYLAAPDGEWRDTIRVPDTYIKFQATDTERRLGREYKILEILLRETKENPEDGRSSFYLARTYNAIGNHSDALKEFERRVSLGGWAEEVYESLYAMAWQKKELGRPWSEIQQQFLEAHNHSPERAEPLYFIADHYMVNGFPSTAFMFAQRAYQLPFPKDAALWVQEDIYAWQVRYVIGMTASHETVKQYVFGAQALIDALKVEPKDQRMIDRLIEYKSLMTPAQWKLLRNFPAWLREAVGDTEVHDADETASTSHTTNDGDSPQVRVVDTSDAQQVQQAFDQTHPNQQQSDTATAPSSESDVAAASAAATVSNHRSLVMAMGLFAIGAGLLTLRTALQQRSSSKND